MTKETIYIDAVTKLNEQDVVIQELVNLLDAVLDSWRNGSSVQEENELYEGANDYLIGLRDE
jgi:hypothetical protein